MQIQIAFYKGTGRLFNRAVSWWERGPYSHCELITGYEGDKAICYSSSFIDGGVRCKLIVLDPAHWDLVTIEVALQQACAAKRWFVEHLGEKYDVAGLVGFVWGPWAERPDHWFCNESVGAALGLPEPWRFGPNSFHAALTYAHQEVLAPA